MLVQERPKLIVHRLDSMLTPKHPANTVGHEGFGEIESIHLIM